MLLVCLAPAIIMVVALLSLTARSPESASAAEVATPPEVTVAYLERPRKEEIVEKEPSWKRELNENRAAAAEEAEEEEEDPFEKLARLQAEAGGETVHRVSGGDSGSTSTAPCARSQERSFA